MADAHSVSVIGIRPFTDRSRPRRLPLAVGVLANEVTKGMRTFWANRLAIGMGMATFGGLYLGMMLIIGRGELPQALLPFTVMGMAAYAALWIASLHTVGDQLEEMRAGTLEQTHLSPVPPTLLVAGRLVATGLQGLAVAAALVATVAVAAGVHLPWDWAATVPVALTLIQVLAFSLLFAGITLAVPFVGEVHHVAVSLVAFFNGAFLPVDQFPPWLHTLARLLPTTLTTEAALDLLHRDATLTGLIADGTLLAALAYTVVLTGLAWAIYVRNYRRALHHGDLGRY